MLIMSPKRQGDVCISTVANHDSDETVSGGIFWRRLLRQMI